MVRFVVGQHLIRVLLESKTIVPALATKGDFLEVNNRRLLAENTITQFSEVAVNQLLEALATKGDFLEVNSRKLLAENTITQFSEVAVNQLLEGGAAHFIHRKANLIYHSLVAPSSTSTLAVVVICTMLGLVY
uniref:Dolichyl-diphosphooligosaccharide--protein glycosyltransferase subunit 2 n=1 Tax=Steinernema glaseri TaxID=37863 RepID=A0A1I8A834_9BILA